MDAGEEAYLFGRANLPYSVRDDKDSTEYNRGVRLPVRGTSPPATLFIISVDMVNEERYNEESLFH